MKENAILKVVMTLCCVFVVFFAYAQLKDGAYEIGDDFAFSTDNWEQSADDFVVEHGKNGFRFADNRRRDVAISRKYGDVMCFGESVMESRVYFRQRSMQRVELSLYNKGDAMGHGVQLAAVDLDQLIKKISEKVNGGPKKMPQAVRVRVKNDRIKAGHKYTMKWPKRIPMAELSWGVSGEDDSRTVEYVRLVFEKSAQKNAGASSGNSRRQSKKGGGYDDNVKNNDEGDTYIANVPMIDQGEKGYCSVATAERVLRYFGQNIDEHEIAQIAATSADKGTLIQSMISAVETIGKKCRLGKREIVAKISSWDDAEKLMKEYNKSAKRMKKAQLNTQDYIRLEGNHHIFEVGKMEQAMDAKVLKAMSMRDKSGYGKFIRGIREQTKRGVPLFWSVRLGVYPEPGIPQSAGGHMRLIIGYNAEKGEVIYTDSWGAGHERKHMPDDWAWTITHNLFYLNPRQ
jgi:hypothetical protein